jgi:hypothetical protein
MLGHHLRLTRDVSTDLEALVDGGFVNVYEVDGEKYYQLVNYDDDAFADIVRKRGVSAYPALACVRQEQSALRADQGQTKSAPRAGQGQGRIEEKRRSLFSETSSPEEQQHIASPSLGAQASDASRWCRDVLTRAIRASGKRRPWRGSVMVMAEEMASHVTAEAIWSSSTWLEEAWAHWRWTSPSVFVRELCARHGIGFDVQAWEVAA